MIIKNINKVLAILLCVIFGNLKAQNNKQCGHCGMDILDNLHTAIVVSKDETIHFDAIECLINYLKKHNENTFLSLNVADYTTGKHTDAKKATYLISKAISSPMGANLTAFKDKSDALINQKEKGGTVYTWDEIKAKFKNPNSGNLFKHITSTTVSEKFNNIETGVALLSTKD